MYVLCPSMVSARQPLPCYLLCPSTLLERDPLPNIPPSPACSCSAPAHCWGELQLPQQTRQHSIHAPSASGLCCQLLAPSSCDSVYETSLASGMLSAVCWADWRFQKFKAPGSSPPPITDGLRDPKPIHRLSGVKI